jgi:hypothetical protein
MLLNIFAVKIHMLRLSPSAATREDVVSYFSVASTCNTPPPSKYLEIIKPIKILMTEFEM